MMLKLLRLFMPNDYMMVNNTIEMVYNANVMAEIMGLSHCIYLKGPKETATHFMQGGKCTTQDSNSTFPNKNQRSYHFTKTYFYLHVMWIWKCMIIK
jgi:hypothetical protein